MTLLILGGSSEASALARALAEDARFAATLSLAGRTREPARAALPLRVGGFGGVEGLMRYLNDARVEALIDATHPFAVQMKRHAVEATRLSNVPLLAIRRPPWRAVDGDQWTEVADLDAAANALGAAPKRVLLTVGRQELAPFRAAPQHFYVVRSVDAPPDDLLPPQAEVITARGPFAEDDETRLMQERRINVLVTKNSGGTATQGKLAAARALGVPVVMVRRPGLPEAPSVETVAEALAWLDARHAGTSTRRGV